MKATYIEDLGVYTIKLPRGSYQINGVAYSNDSYNQKEVEVEVGSVCDIRIATTTKLIAHYTSDSGDTTIGREEYDNNIEALTAGAERVDYEWYFSDLDQEYQYKKYVKKWQPVYNTVVTVSDPIKVEVVKTKIDTGNEFIDSGYSLDSNPTIYTYNRLSAWISIVSDCFKSLGMEYIDNIDYGATKERKVWSNSNHSGIRYVVAFGTYIFDDSWKVPSNYKNTLYKCVEMYNDDKEEIERIIKSKYSIHFDSPVIDGVLAKEVVSFLNTASSHLNGIEVKRNSDIGFGLAKKSLQDCLKYIKDKLADEVV